MGIDNIRAGGGGKPGAKAPLLLGALIPRPKGRGFYRSLASRGHHTLQRFERSLVIRQALIVSS